MTDQGLIGKINVTGLALPSEFKQFIDNGASQAFALWNPIDLGYSAVMIAHDLAIKKAEGQAGRRTISIGRMGKVTLDDTNCGRDGRAVPLRQVEHRRVRQDLLICGTLTGAAGFDPAALPAARFCGA